MGGSQGVVEVVGPEPTAGDCDRAVGAGGRANERPALGGPAIHIRGCQSAADAAGAGVDAAAISLIKIAGLSHTAQLAARGGGDDGAVVAAVDGDRDRLISRGSELVGDPNRERFVVAVTFVESLGGGGAVVELEAPDPGRADGEGAVGD